MHVCGMGFAKENELMSPFLCPLLSDIVMMKAHCAMSHGSCIISYNLEHPQLPVVYVMVKGSLNVQFHDCGGSGCMCVM